MDLVGSQTRGGTDGIVLRKVDIGELFLPVVLELFDDHCQYLAIAWFTRSTTPLPFG